MESNGGNGETRALVQKIVWTVLTIAVSGVITLSVAMVRRITDDVNKTHVGIMLLQGKHRDMELMVTKKVEQLELLVDRMGKMEVRMDKALQQGKQEFWGSRYGKEE